MQEYIIVARSGRSLAVSAKRAGYNVHVLDCYADVDTRESSVTFKQLHYTENGFSESELLESVLAILSDHPDAIVVIGSGFEINPYLIKQLNEITTVYSNDADVICALKNPETLFPLMDRCGINYPETFLTLPEISDNYLAKKIASMGGEGIHWAGKITDKSRHDYYFQKYVDGTVCSVVFLADGRHSKIVGFNHLLQSNQFESMPFLYGGVCSREVNDQHYDEIKIIINSLVKETGLKGLCGIDYVLTDDNKIYVLEVNPRPPASFELHEQTESLFDMHLACFNGDLEKYALQRCYGIRACAILYANFNLLIPRDFVWPDWVSDIPVAGARIKRHEPVCSVHAEEDSLLKINEVLKSRREQIEQQLTRLKI